MRQALGPGALGKPRGSGWRGRWEGGSVWGTHVNPWLFHFNVWQNSLQIKKKSEKKKKTSQASLKQGHWYIFSSELHSLPHLSGEWPLIFLFRQEILEIIFTPLTHTSFPDPSVNVTSTCKPHSYSNHFYHLHDYHSCFSCILSHLDWYVPQLVSLFSPLSPTMSTLNMVARVALLKTEIRYHFYAPTLQWLLIQK